MAAEWQDRGDNSEWKLPLLDHVDVFNSSRDDILILGLVYRSCHVYYCLSFLYCNRIEIIPFKALSRKCLLITSATYFVCLHPSQHFFSYVRTGIPGLNQY